MRGRAARLMTPILLLSLVAGCSSLPRGAALESEIRRDAVQGESGYAFYPVTRGLLPTVAAWPAVNVEPSHGWPRQTPGSQGQLIAPGDRVTIRFWDSSENSLLTDSGQRSADLGTMTVSPSGRVFIPYVGEVRIAGMSDARAREAIQTQLLEISPSAQVQLQLEQGRLNSVDLVSGVKSPGSYPLIDRNLSVLEAISLGGGVSERLRNPRVKLQRGSNLYARSLTALYQNPALDTLVTGGDKIIVDEDRRYFLALGAAGKEDLVYFTQEDLSALEAISMIGGIADTRADPEGILVLREYPREALAAGLRGPRETRVIFSIDLTTADGLFSAKNLQIMPGDVVLATESPVGSLQLALAIVGAGFGTIRTAAALR
ncbi:polysaccharide biosynthesis/export family protein [Oceaniovalibus guishaninsula]|nr:polysaccharide biosynthesis/export family protein [Oceaniovalibus guishaninsula]